MLTRERLSTEHAQEPRTDAGAGKPGTRRSDPAAGSGSLDAVPGSEGREDGRPSLSPVVPEPASGRLPVAHTSSLLPPGQAVPQVEFGAPGPLAEQRRRGGATLRRSRSERTVQTLTPPARR